VARLDQSQQWLAEEAVAAEAAAMPTVALAVLDILAAEVEALAESEFLRVLQQGQSAQAAQAATAICSSSQCKENQ
jgi:hypothetical protein